MRSCQRLSRPALRRRPRPSALARAGLWTLLAAHLVTVWGTSWDIRWHLLIGRDSFWIPPRLMTYSGVTLIVLVSFGVLAWTTSQALRGVAPPGMFRQLGITGTRGYHLAAYSITLTVLAAPISGAARARSRNRLEGSYPLRLGSVW
jgi:hypothetical protein